MALDVLEAVHDRQAVEAVQPVSVGHRSAFAELLVAERRGIVRGAIEQRGAEAVRRVHEPGIGVVEREEVKARSGLEADAEVLALTHEIARRELRLDEEPGSLRVTAAELDVVLPLFTALDGDV